MICTVLKTLPTLGCTPPLHSSSTFSTVSTFGRGLTTLRVASATLATLALATFVVSLLGASRSLRALALGNMLCSVV